MPEVVTARGAGLQLSNETPKLDLGRLRCAKIPEASRDAVVVGKLAGWAAGIEVFKVRDVLYVPELGLPVCDGFVPEEAINYSRHLDVRLGRTLNDGQSHSNGPLLPLANLDRSQHEVCILGNIYSKNFGHWTEELLKVILLEKFGFDGHYAFPTWYSRFAHDALAMLGIGCDRILLIDRPVVYKTALFTTTISHFRAHKFPAVIRRLRDQLYEAAGGELGPAERVWVDRGSDANNGRRIVNEGEVQSFAERHGFHRVDFGRHSFRDQIAVDRGIDVLMGPHGSAFVHCGFMQDKKDIIEIFSPEYINPSVIQLCMALHHSYQQIVPPKSWHTPYKYGSDLLIDVDQLELALSCVELRRVRRSAR